MLKPSVDFSLIRQDFPILKQKNRGKPLVYLDSSATSQKPQCVIDAITRFYTEYNANIHRGVYELSERATKVFETARHTVKEFINANAEHEIIFVRGTTEGINLVAQCFGRLQIGAGDEIILSGMEHHSNIVPWQMLAEQTGAKLKVIPVLDSGELDLDAYPKLFSAKSKLVAVTHASNALGTVNPVKHLTQVAHQHEVPILIDGAQAIPHMPVNVEDIDCDFYVFSSHKIYGPTGVGVLYGKSHWLNSMAPYQGGGDMIETVSFEKTTYSKPPHKFEAGTPDIAGVIGLGEAINYVANLGMAHIASHEQALLTYATQKLAGISGLHIIGNAREKVGVISFIMDGIHPHDMGTILDDQGIAVRAGHHCAMPVMTRFNIPATVRMSLGLYNNQADIDALCYGIEQAKRLFL